MYSDRVDIEPTILLQGPIWLIVVALLVGTFFLTRRLPHYGLGAVIAALPLYQVRGNAGIPTTLLELILLTVLLGLASQWPRWRPRRTPYDLPIIVLLLGTLVAAVLGADPLANLGLWRAYFLEPALFFYAVVVVLRERPATPILLGSLVSLALIGLSTAHRLLQGTALTYDDRLAGAFQSPNYLALAVVPLVLLAVSWPGRALLTTRLLAIAVGTGLVVSSNSRGGYVALAAGALAAGYFWFGRKRTLLVATTGGVLLLGAAALGANALQHRDQQVLETRPVIWREATGLIREHPLLGNGPTSFQESFRERVAGNQTETLYVAPQALSAHNIFLSLWVSWGLAALLGFAALVVLFVRMMWRTNPQLKLVAITMFTAMLVHGLIDTSILKNDLALLFWLALALSLVPVTPTITNKRHTI